MWNVCDVVKIEYRGDHRFYIQSISPKLVTRLIQKIYPPRRIKPVVCSKCLFSVRIVAFIEDGQLVKKILEHLGLWQVKRKPPPRANPPADGILHHL